MKTRIVKKNNPELLRRRGRGFYGRCLAVQFDCNYIVLQNIKGRPREEAIIRYVDFEVSDEELFKVQQIFLKKYGRELLFVKSYSEFCGSTGDGRFFERRLEPINRQSQLEFSS